MIITLAALRRLADPDTMHADDGPAQPVRGLRSDP